MINGVVSTNDRDGCIRTRQVPVNEKRGLSLHARRPQQQTPPSIDRAANGRGSTKHVPPIRRGPSSSLFFVVVMNSSVIGSFVDLPYPRESHLEPAGSLTIMGLYIHTPIQIVFGARMFAKGKPLKLDQMSGCGKAIYTCFLTNIC